MRTDKSQGKSNPTPLTLWQQFSHDAEGPMPRMMRLLALQRTLWLALERSNHTEINSVDLSYMSEVAVFIFEESEFLLGDLQEWFENQCSPKN